MHSATSAVTSSVCDVFSDFRSWFQCWTSSNVEASLSLMSGCWEMKSCWWELLMIQTVNSVIIYSIGHMMEAFIQSASQCFGCMHILERVAQGELVTPPVCQCDSLQKKSATAAVSKVVQDYISCLGACFKELRGGGIILFIVTQNCRD